MIKRVALCLPACAQAVDEVPLLNSTQQCAIQTQDARVLTAKCTEQHLFKPFTNAARENGAVVTGTADLRFVSNAASTFGADVTIASSPSKRIDYITHFCILLLSNYSTLILCIVILC